MVSSNDNGNAVTPQCCDFVCGAHATPRMVGRAVAQVRSHRKLVAEARRDARAQASGDTHVARIRNLPDAAVKPRLLTETMKSPRFGPTWWRQSDPAIKHIPDENFGPGHRCRPDTRQSCEKRFFHSRCRVFRPAQSGSHLHLRRPGCACGQAGDNHDSHRICSREHSSGTAWWRASRRPGGNATGLSNQSTDIAGKRLDLLREVVLVCARVAILANASSRNAVQEMDEVQAAARTLGVDAVAHQVRRAEDIAPAFEAFKGRAQALYVVIEALTTTNGPAQPDCRGGMRGPAAYAPDFRGGAVGLRQ